MFLNNIFSMASLIPAFLCLVLLFLFLQLLINTIIIQQTAFFSATEIVAWFAVLSVGVIVS